MHSIHHKIFILEFKIVQDKGAYKQIDFGAGRSTQGFYQIAKKFEQILDISYSKKSDNFNTLCWNYSYHGVPFQLTYHWDNGTLIKLQNQAPSKEEETAIDEIITVLSSYL